MAPAIEAIRLAPDACAHGFAVALPLAAAMARPTGFERADATIFVRVPIVRRPG